MRKIRRKKKNRVFLRSYSLLTAVMTHRWSRTALLIFCGLSLSLLNTYVAGKNLKTALAELLEIPTNLDQGFEISFASTNNDFKYFDLPAIRTKVASAFSYYQKSHRKVYSKPFSEFLSQRFSGSEVLIHHSNTGRIYLRLFLPSPKLSLNPQRDFFIAEKGHLLKINDLVFQKSPPQLTLSDKVGNQTIYAEAVGLLDTLETKGFAVDWIKYEKGRGFSANLLGRNIVVTFGKDEFSKRIDRLTSLLNSKVDPNAPIEFIELDYANKAVISEKKL